MGPRQVALKVGKEGPPGRGPASIFGFLESKLHKRKDAPLAGNASCSRQHREQKRQRVKSWAGSSWQGIRCIHRCPPDSRVCQGQASLGG